MIDSATGLYIRNEQYKHINNFILNMLKDKLGNESYFKYYYDSSCRKIIIDIFYAKKGENKCFRGVIEYGEIKNEYNTIDVVKRFIEDIGFIEDTQYNIDILKEYSNIGVCYNNTLNKEKHLWGSSKIVC